MKLPCDIRNIYDFSRNIEYNFEYNLLKKTIKDFFLKHYLFFIKKRRKEKKRYI